MDFTEEQQKLYMSLSDVALSLNLSLDNESRFPGQYQCGGFTIERPGMTREEPAYTKMINALRETHPKLMFTDHVENPYVEIEVGVYKWTRLHKDQKQVYDEIIEFFKVHPGANVTIKCSDKNVLAALHEAHPEFGIPDPNKITWSARMPL